MSQTPTNVCAQARRALRLIQTPHAPKIDEHTIRKGLPDLEGLDWAAIIQIIVQIVLSLMDQKDDDNDDADDDENAALKALRLIVRQAALDTVPRKNLPGDLPHLIDAITATAHALPEEGFASLREAREAMRLATNATLRDHAKGWHVWNTAVTDALDTLEEDGHLTNEVDYRQAWLAVAYALQQLQRAARM